MNRPGTSHRDFAAFGPFRLYPSKRLLERSGTATKIGGRALDILVALVERAGQVVSNRDLMREVWPTTTVGEATLRVQMTALRRALGSDCERYVSNIPGRGYGFVAPVMWSPRASEAAAAPAAATRRLSLPPPLGRTVGRDQTCREIAAELATNRFVTIVGAAGIGKTTVAVQVGHGLLDTFGDEIYFVDLGALKDDKLVGVTLLGALGLPAPAENPVQSLLNFTQGRPLLLLLDNCEHVIAGAAVLAEKIFENVSNISILATSREAMRVEGEHVYRLDPLRYPQLVGSLAANEAMSFSAMQLFIERVSAATHGFSLSDEDAAPAVEICARFDGIPLALEIAAGRVDAFGIRKMAALLTDSLGLIWEGRRTAPPRQRTLSAALGWSFRLLSDFERLTLESLSVFVATFTLEAARAVVSEDETRGAEVAIAIASLVSKSLISLVAETPTARFHLLQTTRAYARERLMERGDLNKVAGRHVDYFTSLLRRLNEDASISSTADAFAIYGEHLGNVREGLEWSFSRHGSDDRAASLSAQAGPMFIELSLLVEGLSWMGRAVERLPKLPRDPRREMQIRAALGVSSMFTRGGEHEARRAFERGLELALETGDSSYVLGLLGMLNILLQRIGDYRAALAVAERGAAIAEGLGDPIAIMVSRWTLGVSQHVSGDLARSQVSCETALLPRPTSTGARALRFLGYDHRVRALVVETISLWLRGYHDRAVRAAALTVEEAERGGQPIPMCVSYLSAATVLLGVGDLKAAEARIEQVVAHAERYSLSPFRAAGLGLRGGLLIRRDDLALGVRMLQESLATLHRGQYFVLATALAGHLAKGLAAMGRLGEARETIETVMRRCEARSYMFEIANLLRIQAEIAMAQPSPDLEAAERWLLSAIDWARRQSALFFELRAATALGRLWAENGRSADANRLVKGVYDQFTEGFDTTDLLQARQFLDRLGAPEG